MAIVYSLTAERMAEIEGASVVSGEIVDGNLILITADGWEINAGRVEGPEGPPGESGSGGGSGSADVITHVQGVATDTWVITHSYPGGFPHVTVVNGADEEVIGDIRYDSDTQITVLFSGDFSGKAYLS